MTYLLKRGSRVAHIALHDPKTGAVTGAPLCRTKIAFDLSSNVAFGRPVCKLCRRELR